MLRKIEQIAKVDVFREQGGILLKTEKASR